LSTVAATVPVVAVVDCKPKRKPSQSPVEDSRRWFVSQWPVRNSRRWFFKGGNVPKAKVGIDPKRRDDVTNFCVGFVVLLKDVDRAIGHVLSTMIDESGVYGTRPGRGRAP
jgi:hypothetical protein